MNPPRTYPEGVSCWIDLEVADVEAAANFYAVLFGWTYSDVTALGSQLRYLIAQLDGSIRVAQHPVPMGRPTNEHCSRIMTGEL